LAQRVPPAPATSIARTHQSSQTFVILPEIPFPTSLAITPEYEDLRKAFQFYLIGFKSYDRPESLDGFLRWIEGGESGHPLREIDRLFALIIARSHEVG
jgi:hypothetical protein